MGGFGTAPPRARPSSATVSLAVDRAGIIRHAEWHGTASAALPDLAHTRLLDIVEKGSRQALMALFLGATSTGARARGLVQADLGDGLQPVSATVEDRLGDLGVIVVRLLRLAEAADELDALAQLAFWDPLTGLANRALFGEHLRNELERAKRSHRLPAVLSADVDLLKRVNDEFGHRTGDALLVEVGQRLRTACRPFDVPARLSGDEYAVLCPEVCEEQQARQLAQRLTDAVRGSADLGGVTISISISVGWAIAHPEDCADGGAGLLHRADMCMYGVKRFGASA